MSEEQTDHPSSGHGWAWALITALVVYLLLPGPLVYLADHKVIKNDGPFIHMVEVVYAPLSYLLDNVRPLERLYESYFRLWGAEHF